MVLPPVTLPTRSASRRSTAASAPSSNSPPVPRESECHAVVSSPLGDLPYVTARGDHDGDKAVSQPVEGDVVQVRTN
jgi:hypothetical protein